MKQPTRMIVVALLFAAALIASSYFLRGQGIGSWVDSAIYIAFFSWLTSEWAIGPTRQPCRVARAKA
jgi:hypothetical protein